MESIQFSTISAKGTIVPIVAGLFLLAFIVSCRQSSPTDSVQSVESDTNHCCHGMLTLTAQDTLGHPIQGAAVTLSGDGITRNETTGDDGTTTIVELCSGVYEYHVSKDGYTTAHGLDTLTCNDTTSLTVTLHAGQHSDTACSSASIDLIVDDSATHTALSGGTASLYLNGTLISSKTMVSTGTIWTGLHPGKYSFYISKDGYNTIEFIMDSLSCDQSRTVDHNMSALHSSDSCCGGVAELTVTDSSTHNAIQGATVVLYKSGVEVSSTTTSDNGSARFGSLCTGSYRMTIAHDGYTESVIEWSEDCNTTHGFAKGLLSTYHNTCDTASISLWLEDSTNQSFLSGVSVTVRIDGSSTIIATGTTDSNGYFNATGLVSPDNYIISFTKDGYNEKAISMQFSECHNYHEAVPLSHH